MCATDYSDGIFAENCLNNTFTITIMAGLTLVYWYKYTRMSVCAKFCVCNPFTFTFGWTVELPPKLCAMDWYSDGSQRDRQQTWVNGVARKHIICEI